MNVCFSARRHSKPQDLHLCMGSQQTSQLNLHKDNRQNERIHGKQLILSRKLNKPMDQRPDLSKILLGTPLNTCSRDFVPQATLQLPWQSLGGTVST